MNHLIFEHGGKIIAKTRGGAALIECFREAAQLSLEHCAEVEFEFNGKTYLTQYRDLLECAKEIVGASQDD